MLAAILVVAALPLIGVLVVLVRLTSPGPAIYRQTRVGKHGRVFIMYKLRTMRCDAEAGTGAVWSMSNDPRVTPLGRLLRQSHLDELPQLFNVLKGDMSLVGPRPERPEFVHVLADQVRGYLDRLAVRPGVTGLAQLNLPPDSDLESVRRKLALDVEYIESAGILMDSRIVVCTALSVLKLSGVRFFRLQRQTQANHFVGNSRQGGNEADGARASAGHAFRRTETEPPVPDVTASSNGRTCSHEPGGETHRKPKPR